MICRGLYVQNQKEILSFWVVSYAELSRCVLSDSDGLCFSSNKEKKGEKKKPYTFLGLAGWLSLVLSSLSVEERITT